MHDTAVATYEHHFVTLDQDADGNSLRFNLIEDENGVFWGYGHVAACEFVAEVNRWMLHVGLDKAELPNESTTSVDHLSAHRVDDDFKLVDPQNVSGVKDSFPVTRLWL